MIVTQLLLPSARPLPPAFRRVLEQGRRAVNAAAGGQDVGAAAAGLAHLAAALRGLADQLTAYGFTEQRAHVAVAAAALEAALTSAGEADEETCRGEIDRAADRALDALMAALDAEGEQVMALPPATEVRTRVTGEAA